VILKKYSYIRLMLIFSQNNNNFSPCKKRKQQGLKLTIMQKCRLFFKTIHHAPF
jgi:hypothetical protein